MKSKLLSVFVIFLSILSMSVFDAFAESEGFRGIKWGDSFRSVTDMNYERTNNANGAIYYTRGSEELIHHGAVIKKIEYGFINDKFTDVSIEATGTVNCKALKDSSLEEFGIPTEELNGKLFKWVAGKTVRVYLEKPDGRSCVLKMGSITPSQDNSSAKQQ